MIKAWIAPAVVLSLLAVAASGAQYYGDHRYVMQETFTQSIHQQRVWDLMDRINGLKDKAAIENRKLSPAEERQIERWQDEIKKLGDRG